MSPIATDAHWLSAQAKASVAALIAPLPPTLEIQQQKFHHERDARLDEQQNRYESAVAEGAAAREETPQQRAMESERRLERGSYARRDAIRAQSAKADAHRREHFRDSLSDARRAPASTARSQSGASAKPAGEGAEAKSPAPASGDKSPADADRTGAPRGSAGAAREPGTPPRAAAEITALRPTPMATAELPAVRVALSAAPPGAGAAAVGEPSGSASSSRGAVTPVSSSGEPARSEVGSSDGRRGAPASRGVPVAGGAANPSGGDRANSTDAESAVERIVRLARHQFATGAGKTVLRLEPAELGAVRIELLVRGERVEVMLHAERPLAYEMLFDRVHELRQRLEQQGLDVARLELRSTESGVASVAARDAEQHESAGSANHGSSGQTGSHARHDARDGPSTSAGEFSGRTVESETAAAPAEARVDATERTTQVNVLA